MKTLSSFTRFIKAVNPRINLHKHQKDLFKLFEKTDYLEINKFRQGGFTTLAYLYLLWKTSTNSNFKGLLVVNNYHRLTTLKKEISNILGREFITEEFNSCGIYSAGTHQNSRFITISSILLRQFNNTGDIIILDECYDDKYLSTSIKPKKIFKFLPSDTSFYKENTVNFTPKLSKKK